MTIFPRAKVEFCMAPGTRVKAKLWVKLKTLTPDGWRKRAHAGHRGVTFVCVDAAKFGNANAEWVSNTAAMLLLISESYK